MPDDHPFQTVYEYAHPSFGGTTWAVLIAVDVAILDCRPHLAACW